MYEWSLLPNEWVQMPNEWGQLLNEWVQIPKEWGGQLPYALWQLPNKNEAIT